MENPLINFLASYGPVPNGQNMYDEFVVSTAENAGLKPLAIEEPHSKKIAKILTSENPVSVILTGTAGDGKTYTARKVLEHISGGTKAWTNQQSESSFDCRENGFQITFVKDLSELGSDEKKKLFPRLLSVIQGDDTKQEIFVICVNDGHLLKTWRENVPDTPSAKRVIEKILTMLRDDEKEDSELQMRLINMSRRSHADTLDEIIDEIMGHSAWEKCEGCPALTGEDLCPIRLNRDIIAGKHEQSIRARLRSLIQIAAADDDHLSIRQIVILVVNALLGDGKAGAKPLLNCDRARQRAEAKDYTYTNPYSNIFGENHPPDRRHQYAAFEILGRFGIGEETNNHFDDTLLESDDEYPLPSDDEYGTPLFERTRVNYRENPAEHIETLRSDIRAQRRRLFFLAPEISLRGNHDASPWCLCAYHSGDLYINLLRDPDDQCRKKAKSARRLILCGMNRTLTGALTDTSNALWLTQPSGVYLGNEVRHLIVFEPIRWNDLNYRIALSSPSQPGRPPQFEIYRVGEKQPLSSLILTPTLFEFLARVAGGALPTSFSNQCYQDLRNFQIRSVGAIEKLQRAAGVSFIHETVDTSDAELKRERIHLLEDEL